MSVRSLRWPLALVLVVLAALVAHGTPVLEGRDEAGQLELALHWAGGGGFPTPTAGAPRHGHQPPLGAWLLALAVRAAGLEGAELVEHEARDGAPTALRHGPLDHPRTSEIARRVRDVRWVSVACALLVALGTWRLAAHVTGSPRLAALATVLVAANPALAVFFGTAGSGPLAAAAAVLLLPAVVRLGEPGGPARADLLWLGIGIGLAALLRLSAAFLLPAAIVALLLHDLPAARAWSAVQRLLLGALLLLGPWCAWNLHAWGDPFALGARPAAADGAQLAGGDPYASLAARAADALARFGQDGVIGLGQGQLALGPTLPLVHGAALALGVLGLLGGWSALGAARRRAALLLVVAVLGAAAGALVVLLRTGQVDATLLFPAWPALATLVALGGGTLLGRAASAAGALALLGGAAFVVLARWLPAMAPPDAADPFLVSVRPPFVEEESARLKLRGPEDGVAVVEPPLLRWVPDADPTQRYSVHLGIVGTPIAWRTYEDTGLLLSDRWQLDERRWSELPPDVELAWRVVRLPRAAEWEQAPWGTLAVTVSEVRHLRRVLPPE